jgi:hypothetical protein
MAHNRERRRDPRIATSVMSEVFVSTGVSGKLRYFGPAIVIDMSESGLALAMDAVPRGHSTVHVRNRYFRVEAIIRNSSSLDAGFRIGAEFTSELEWQPGSEVLLSPQAA